MPSHIGKKEYRIFTDEKNKYNILIFNNITICQTSKSPSVPRAKGTTNSY